MLNEHPTKKSTFRGGYQPQGRKDTLTATQSKLLSAIESSKIHSNDSNQFHGRRTLVSAAHETILFNDLYQPKQQQSSPSYGRSNNSSSRPNDDSRQQQQQQRPSWKKSMISDPRETMNTIVVSDSSIPSSSDTSAFVPFTMNVNPIKSIQQRIPPKKLPSDILSFWMSPSEQNNVVVSSSPDTSISSLSNNNSFDGQQSHGNITNNRFNRNNDTKFNRNNDNNGDNNSKDDQGMVRNPFSYNNIQRTKGCQTYVPHQNRYDHVSSSNKRSSHLRISEQSNASNSIRESGNTSSTNEIFSRNAVSTTNISFDGQQLHGNSHSIITNTDNNSSDNRSKDDQIMVRNPFDYSNYYAKNNDNQRTKRCRTYVPIKNHYNHVPIVSNTKMNYFRISETMKSSYPFQDSGKTSINEISSHNAVSSTNDVTEKQIEENFNNNNSTLTNPINNNQKQWNKRNWIQPYSFPLADKVNDNVNLLPKKVNEKDIDFFRVPVEIELNITKNDETVAASNQINSLKNHPYNEIIRNRNSFLTSDNIASSSSSSSTSSSSSQSNLWNKNINHHTTKNVSTTTRSSIHNKVKRPHPTRSRQFVYSGTKNVSSSTSTIQQYRDSTTNHSKNEEVLSSPAPSPEHYSNDVDEDLTINSTMIFDMLNDDSTNIEFSNTTDIESTTLMENNNKMAYFPISLPSLSLRSSNGRATKQRPYPIQTFTIQEQKPVDVSKSTTTNPLSAPSCQKQQVVEIHSLKRKIDELTESMERLMKNQMSLQEHVRQLEQQQI